MSTTNAKPLNQAAEELAGLIPDPASDQNFPQFIEKFKDFLQQLEKNPQDAPGALGWLDQILEGPVYQEIGKILRKFHDQLNLLRKDLPGSLPNLNEEEISGMSDKLEHIMDMTSKAAHETLDLTERISHRLDDQGAKLLMAKKSLEKILEEQSLSPDHQKAAEDQLEMVNQMLQTVTDNSEDIGAILMAQGYQDLTGQLIQKLLKLVHNMESDLLELIQSFGQIPQDTQTTELKGPLREEDGSKHNQQDVDGLLTQFGF